MAVEKNIEKVDPSEGSRDGLDGQIGDILVEWNFPEYIQYKRGFLWYLLAIVATALLLIYAYFSDNQLFMVLIVLAAVIFIVANSRHPESIYFALAEGGFILKDKFFHYEDMTSFWIIYQPPYVKTLYLEPASILSPRIQIHLENQDPAQIRELLLQFMNEDLAKEDEPTSEVWGRLFKL